MKTTKTENRKTTVGKISNFLRREIMTAGFEPGRHLKESQISAEFGVSRVPVREAFRLLQSEGLLKVIPNRGSFVSQISKKNIKESAIVYRLLAPVMLEKAIPRYNAATYKKAYAIIGKIESAKEYARISVLLWEFAKTILGPSKYEFMLCIFEEIYKQNSRILCEFFKREETKELKLHVQREFLDLCKEKKKDEAIRLWIELVNNLELAALKIADEL